LRDLQVPVLCVSEIAGCSKALVILSIAHTLYDKGYIEFQAAAITSTGAIIENGYSM
jgi:hypothetical protein